MSAGVYIEDKLALPRGSSKDRFGHYGGPEGLKGLLLGILLTSWRFMPSQVDQGLSHLRKHTQEVIIPS